MNDFGDFSAGLVIAVTVMLAVHGALSFFFFTLDETIAKSKPFELEGKIYQCKQVEVKEMGE